MQVAVCQLNDCLQREQQTWVKYEFKLHIEEATGCGENNKWLILLFHLLCSVTSPQRECKIFQFGVAVLDFILYCFAPV